MRCRNYIPNRHLKHWESGYPLMVITGNKNGNSDKKQKHGGKDT